MNRTEARKIAKQVSELKLASKKMFYDKDIKFVGMKIKEAAKKGEFSVHISLDDISEDAIDVIHEVYGRKGYSVMDGYLIMRTGFIVVSWE